MPVTLTGAEMKRFYEDPAIWGTKTGDTWYEEAAYKINDVEQGDDSFDITTLSDDDVVTVSGGYIVNAPPKVPEDYVKAIRYWLKLQSTRQVLVEAPADKLQEILQAVRAAGGKVVGA